MSKEIIARAREAVRVDTIKELGDICDLIQEQIDNSKIMGRTEKLLLGEAMVNIDKARHILRIKRV